MSNYSLEAIQKKLQQLSNSNASRFDKPNNRPKLTWFKPELGQYSVRFLPYKSPEGQPFEEVSYYDNKELSDRRMVAPVQYGAEDPIFNVLTELKKDRSKESWRLTKILRPKERFYALVLVRGQEDKGIQVWDLSSKLVQKIYSKITHADYREENLMDPEEGYDFTVDVTPTDKTFNGHPVKEIEFTVRRKPSKLTETKTEMDKLLNSMPNLYEYFKSMTPETEQLQIVIENFLQSSKDVEVVADDGTFTEELQVEEPEQEKEASRGSSKSKAEKLKKKLDAAFDDL